MTFLLVPGAWLGGWCWCDVAAILRAAGHRVVAVTLTGLGERAHLLTPDVGLYTHVEDVLGILKYRDIRQIVLVGHSYGGTVITAVAGLAADRIRSVVNLDASIPRNGESNSDVLGPAMAEQIRDGAKRHGDGWRVLPPPVMAWGLTARQRAMVEFRLTPHPLRSLEDSVRLRSGTTIALRRAFIRSSSNSALYGRLLEQARLDGWMCRELSGGQCPMLTNPQGVAAALLNLQERP